MIFMECYYQLKNNEQQQKIVPAIKLAALLIIFYSVAMPAVLVESTMTSMNANGSRKSKQ